MNEVTVQGVFAGFPAQFKLSSDSLDELLAGILALRDRGVQPTGETRAPLRPLQPGQTRALVTKIKRDGDVVRLWFRGCQYETTKIFELSDLAEVGIDYSVLQDGAEVPARFFVVYALSDKLNKEGNAYKDVIWLERAEGYAVRTDPLGNVIEIAGEVAQAEPAHAPAAARPAAPPSEPPSPLDEYFPRPESPAPAAPTRPILPDAKPRFYARLSELLREKRVPPDAAKREPLAAHIAAGSWDEALGCLEAQAH